LRKSIEISLDHDATKLNRIMISSLCLSMTSAQTLRVCREGKPAPTFPDHALGVTLNVAAVKYPVKQPSLKRPDFDLSISTSPSAQRPAATFQLE
jgi:hypothetical protein